MTMTSQKAKPKWQSLGNAPVVTRLNEIKAEISELVNEQMTGFAKQSTAMAEAVQALANMKTEIKTETKPETKKDKS